MYHVGTSYKWGGSTIYWQVDKKGKVRTGIVMLSNPNDGHRVKVPHPYVEPPTVIVCALGESPALGHAARTERREATAFVNKDSGVVLFFLIFFYIQRA